MPQRGWFEVEEAMAALSFFSEPPLPQLTHGICDVCSQGLLQALTIEPGPRRDGSVRWCHGS